MKSTNEIEEINDKNEIIQNCENFYKMLYSVYYGFTHSDATDLYSFLQENKNSALRENFFNAMQEYVKIARK